MRKLTIILCMIGSMIVSSIGTYAGIKWFSEIDVGEQQIEVKPEQRLAKIEQAMDLILEDYVETVDEKVLVEGAIEGMVKKLDDPYSVYMDPEQSTQFNSSLDSSFEGIGAEISESEGKIIIVAPFKNSPAEKAGLKPYDQIIRVNGEDITNWNVLDVTQKIRGKKGTTVTLEIRREGIQELLKIDVVRDEIPLDTVFSKVIKQDDKKIGYIEITSFSRDTGKDFSEHLGRIEKDNIDGLILDVRGNPGGLLSSVNEIAAMLITDKKPIVQIANRNEKVEQIYSKLKERKPYPIVVLTDKGSASASEILAAALKEGEGYPVIGEATFGKGTVQQQKELSDRSQIKLTMYKWLTPDGNWIHKTGIQPDIPVEQSELYHLHPLQIEKELKQNMNNEQIKYAQQILKSLEYPVARADGYFDDSTVNSVKAFQRDMKLSQTGIIDKKTAGAMEQAVRDKKENIENDRQLMMALRYFKYDR